MRFLSPSNPTFILALVLGVLLGYLLIIELPGEKAREEAEENNTRLLDLEAAEIKRLTIRYPGEEIILENSGSGDWSMTRPVSTETDPQAIRGFLETLLDLKYSRLVMETGGNPEEFGLAHPNLEVAIDLPEKTERIRVGDDAPVGNLVYMGRESDGRVITVEKWVQGSLTRTVYDLREKRFLQFNEDGIEGILLSFPGHEIRFEKTGEDWVIQKPLKDSVDPDSLSSLLGMLNGLTAESFIDPGPEFDRTKKELVSPGKTVVLREGAFESRLRFFESSEEDRAYVLKAEEDPIFLVTRARMNEIKPELFHYQDKHLLRFDAPEIQKITVDGPQEKYELIRSGGKWTMDGEEKDVQQHLADRLLTQIGELRAFEPADPSSRNRLSSGLDSPGHTIRLFSGKPEPVGTLKVGNEWKGMLFTRGRAALGDVMINKDFLDEIPRKTELTGTPEPPPGDSSGEPGE